MNTPQAINARALEQTMEMLTFILDGQAFGINVFKVKEIVHLQANERLASLPRSHPYVRGVKQIRDMIVPVIDTSKAINKHSHFSSSRFLLIVELSNQIRGLIVDSVSNIEHVPWSDVEQAPKRVGAKSYVTSIAKVGSEIVPILDVEKILSEIEGNPEITLAVNNVGKGRTILIIDDSLVAYKQVARCAEALGFDTYRCADGESGYDHLISLAEGGIDVARHYPLVIVDIEMPKMDGYQLTAKVRQTESLKGIRIMINSSLSSGVSKDMAYSSGADMFLSKFNPKAIQSALLDAANGNRHSAI